MRYKKSAKTDVAIIGTGAQAKYFVNSAKHYPQVNIIAMTTMGKKVDTDFRRDLRGIRLLNDVSDLKKIARENKIKVMVAVSDNREKRRIIEELKRAGLGLINMVHHKAVVADTAKMGCNVQVNAGAIVQPYAGIGDGVMIHSNAVVEHDCRIEECANLGPGVNLAGWVHVERCAYIYTGASVIPGIRIGAFSVVGAGSTVIKDVPDKVIVAGDPARVIREL
jgi:sugar O-acyltransferase (sialic acid O-acetyltransferase NeuD family)